ncbi:hypothetical protein FDUTEX481_07518 [Tolypothrix sp. PCC 7601]|nr:hypothetical protein FDUTEX481_07518 [Tolypothrix sp. PCC 7601]
MNPIFDFVLYAETYSFTPLYICCNLFPNLPKCLNDPLPITHYHD